MLGEESAYQYDSVFAFDAYDGPAAVPWPLVSGAGRIPLQRTVARALACDGA